MNYNYKIFIIITLALLLFYIIGIQGKNKEIIKEETKENKKNTKTTDLNASVINNNNMIKQNNATNKKDDTAKAKPFVFLTSDNSGFVLDDDIKDKLLNSKEDSFNTENILAQRASVKFLKTGYKIWTINTYPGLSGEPVSAIGVVDNKLVLLADLASTIDFYNQAVIVPNDKFLITSIALDILKVAYSIDEFQYGTEYDHGDDVSHARGYKVISSIKAIKNYTPITDNYVSMITKPTTLILGDVGKAVFKTTIWFWGAHNCELHRFDMTSEKSIGFSLVGISEFKITQFKDEKLANVGLCTGLFYK